MIQRVDEKVSIIFIYDHEKGLAKPFKMQWNKRTYSITKIGYHHKIREGKNLFHIYSVSNQNLAFRLKFDTDTLHWILEEISDGLAN